MNNKAYNRALNNKVFLGLWFVLFAALILTVNWLLRMPVSQAEALNTRLARIDKQITRLQAIHAEFLLEFDKEDNLLILKENGVEKEADHIIASIRNEVAGFKAGNTFKSRTAIDALDEFSIVLNQVGDELSNLFMAAHELGNKNSGLVSRWLGLSKGMLSVSSPPDGNILQELNQIKLLESEYLLFRDIRLLENIAILAEMLRSQVMPEEGGIIPADIDSYLALAGNLVALEKRIGYSSDQGIIPGLEVSLQKLTAAFDNAAMLAHGNYGRIRTWWNIIRYAVLLLLTFSGIYFFIRLFNRSIFKPLHQLADLSSKLAAGELPGQSVAAGNIQDMKILKESFEKHVTGLKDKLAFVKTMNQNGLNSQLVLSGVQDSLGIELIQLQQKILETAEQQSKNDEENLRRRYMNEGLAKFADVLRSGGNDLATLGDAFIREIVKYLNAIQGGFFILDDSQKSAPVLNLVSAFAYNRKKFMQKSLAFGEGLVGTCAREKQTINLTEIPKGYISITSGLGDTLPDNLMLIPVLHENALIGVLEIASLHKFEAHEIEFAEEVGRSLASTIIYTRNNQRTAELLTKSQQQALEMAEQEEEMRQNMEELKATQEESTRREEQSKGIAEAINNALFVIEYDSDGIIQEANERFCGFLGCDRVEIIGKPHQEVFNGTLKTDALFWQEVQENVLVIKKEQIKQGKKSYRLKEHFTFVSSRDGNAVKFINFATDDGTGNS